MKYSDKLDVLQEVVKEHAGEPHKVYLIGLLAEHAEEDGCTQEVLEWAQGVLEG